MKTETLFSHKSDEWETPEDFFQDLNREFCFTLDACANQNNKKCERYYSPEENGLLWDWEGETVWCNPPYSKMKEWARKCYYEGHKPNTIVVMLIPSRTDTWWYQNYVLHRAEVRFIKGRLRFCGGNVNAPFPSALVIYRGPEEKGKELNKNSRQMTWEDLENDNET